MIWVEPGIDDSFDDLVARMLQCHKLFERKHVIRSSFNGIELKYRGGRPEKLYIQNAIGIAKIDLQSLKTRKGRRMFVKQEQLRKRKPWKK